MVFVIFFVLFEQECKVNIEAKLFEKNFSLYPLLKGKMLAGDVVAFNINFTYVVRLMYIVNERTFKACSSAAVAPDVILSAAHCLVEKTTDVVYASRVRLTTLDAMAQEKGYRAREAFVHPRYVPSEENDVCIIRVEGQLPATVKPIRIEWGANYGREDCIGAGYGARYFQPFQANLNIPLLSRVHFHKTILLPNDICASAKPITGSNANKVVCVLLHPGIGPCVGDSGGPMICRGALRGLLSRGWITGDDESCGSASGILVYEQVNAYKVWITKMVRETNPASTAPATQIPTHTIFLSLITIYKYHSQYTQIVDFNEKIHKRRTSFIRMLLALTLCNSCYGHWVVEVISHLGKIPHS